MRPSAKHLFTAYFQVGVSSFGGANAWARRMLVEKRGWLTDREFAERLGLGQVLHQLDELLPQSSVPWDDLLAVALLIWFGVQTLLSAGSAGETAEEEREALRLLDTLPRCADLQCSTLFFERKRLLLKGSRLRLHRRQRPFASDLSDTLLIFTEK